jgi:hypothetical protein
MKPAYKAAFGVLAAGLILIIYGLTTYFSDPVRTDLLNYVNEGLSRIRVLDQEADRRLTTLVRSVREPGAVAEGLETEVIPAYEQLRRTLDEIRPITPDVQKVHEIYVQAVDLQVEGLRLWLDAAKSGNAARSAEGQQLRVQGFNKTHVFRNELTTLAREHEVYLQ